MTDLQLEIRAIADKSPTFETPEGAVLVMTPAVGEDYWAYRVRLTDDQAVIGFPKFGTIGIGFAREEDWNTNLPYRLPAADIYAHIARNALDDSITPERAIQAIDMIRQAVALERGTELL